MEREDRMGRGGEGREKKSLCSCNQEPRVFAPDVIQGEIRDAGCAGTSDVCDSVEAAHAAARRGDKGREAGQKE